MGDRPTVRLQHRNGKREQPPTSGAACSMRLQCCSSPKAAVSHTWFYKFRTEERPITLTYSLSVRFSKNIGLLHNRSPFFSVSCLFLPSLHFQLYESFFASSSNLNLDLPTSPSTFWLNFKNVLSHSCVIQFNHVPQGPITLIV
jgi:hypothetical protein